MTTKSGALKFETYDKLAALAQLAKVLGVAPEPQSQTVNNTQVNVGQVQVSGCQDNALESLRRLAFAIQKAARAEKAGLLEGTSHADDPGRKGPSSLEGEANPPNGP